MGTVIFTWSSSKLPGWSLNRVKVQNIHHGNVLNGYQRSIVYDRRTFTITIDVFKPIAGTPEADRQKNPRDIPLFWSTQFFGGVIFLIVPLPDPSWPILCYRPPRFSIRVGDHILL